MIKKNIMTKIMLNLNILKYLYSLKSSEIINLVASIATKITHNYINHICVNR